MESVASLFPSIREAAQTATLLTTITQSACPSKCVHFKAISNIVLLWYSDSAFYLYMYIFILIGKLENGKNLFFGEKSSFLHQVNG